VLQAPPARSPAITASPAQKRPPTDERTVVGQLPGTPEDDADFTSIIDNLGD
jgi:hypothetical protein